MTKIDSDADFMQTVKKAHKNIMSYNKTIWIFVNALNIFCFFLPSCEKRNNTEIFAQLFSEHSFYTESATNTEEIHL